MKLTSKKILIVYLILAGIISAVILAFIFAPALLTGSLTNPRLYYADFDDYSKDFKKVCAWAKEYSGGEDVTFLLSASSIKEGEIRDITNGKDITVPDDIAQSLSVISKEAWGSKSSFNSIKVKGSRVYFGCEEFPYYVVYSPKGRPWKAFGKFVFSERICPCWYHVTRMK